MSTRTYTNNKRPAPGSSGQGGKSGYQGKSSGYQGKSGQKGGYGAGGNGSNYGKPQRDFRPTKPQPGSFKGKQPQKEEAAVRRKRPVTQGGGSEEEKEDDDEADDDEMDVDQPEGAEGAGATGENGEPAEKRPKLSKAEKAALHAAQPHRTSLLPSHPLLHGTLLPLWEKARRADLGKEERKVAVKELYDSAKGRIGEISRGHKGGRVLQTIVKYGGKEERLGVAMELQPQWREMMESKYSKFLMAKLIRYVPSIRPLLIPALAPHLDSLLAHAHAVQPLSDFFDLWASAKEKRLLVRGFYPKEVAIFDGGKGEEGLEGTLAAMGGEGKGRERVLEGVEKVVLDVFNATQKTALAQGLFHRLVLEYVTCIFRFLPAEEAEAKKQALLEASLESLPEIVHTKDGSAVVRTLLVRGGAKDRKQILQHLRKHVEAMCKDADAQLVLFTAFDCVDDTKLMGKAFVSDIVALTPTLASDKNGRRAILYLLTPTSTRHFMPSTLAALSAAAQTARDIGTSKKDPVTRRKEILGYAAPGLLDVVAEKAEELVRDPGAGLLVQEIMLSATGDKSKAIEALVAPLRTPYVETVDAPAAEDKIETDEAEVAEDADAEVEVPAEEQVSTSHVLDLAHATRTYKVLLTGGHFDMKTKTVEVVDAQLGEDFAQAVWAAITSEEAGGNDNVVKLAQGGAAFVMVELVEALRKAGETVAVKKVLGSVKVRKAIETSGKKGATLLADKLASL